MKCLLNLWTKVNSIEEILSAVLREELGASETVFAASGREDIDVKCLGTGRPFFMEFIHPKRTKFARHELKRYQKLINASTNEMEVRDLQYVDKDQTKLIREGQNDKTKCYTALCYCYSKLNQDDIDKLNGLTEVEVFQKTPIRVLHRFETILSSFLLLLLPEVGKKLKSNRKDYFNYFNCELL